MGLSTKQWWKMTSTCTLYCYSQLSMVQVKIILFISYKVVKGILAITFLSVLISSWNFHDVCQRFLYNQKRSLIRLKQRIFPIDPHYKKCPLFNVMSIDMTLQKLAIFIMEVYGKISHFLSDPTEILFLVM